MQNAYNISLEFEDVLSIWLGEKESTDSEND